MKGRLAPGDPVARAVRVWVILIALVILALVIWQGVDPAGYARAEHPETATQEAIYGDQLGR